MVYLVLLADWIRTRGEGEGERAEEDDEEK